MKDGKSTLIDEILAELLMNLGEYMQKLLYEIITSSYKKGNIPLKYIKSRIITLHKKRTTIKFNNSKTIFILSLDSKILLEIVEKKKIKLSCMY